MPKSPYIPKQEPALAKGCAEPPEVKRKMREQLQKALALRPAVTQLPAQEAARIFTARPKTLEERFEDAHRRSES